MASTNKTQNIELSQFIGTDRPTWLGDYNGDMQKIDEAIGELKEGESGTGGQITDLKQDVADLKNNVNALQIGYNGHSTAISQNSERIAGVETVNTQQNLRLDKLEGDVAALTANDEWIIVGDGLGVNNPNFMSTLISLNPKKTIYNACKAGAGASVSGNSYLQNLQSIISQISNHNRVSKIVLLFGLNNTANQNFITETNAFVAYCKATFINAQIYFGLLYGDTGDSFNSASKDLLLNAINIQAITNGVNYISGSESWLNRYREYLNGSNLTNAGATFVGGALSSLLNGNKSIWLTGENTNANAQIKQGFTSNLTCYTQMHNGQVIFTISNFALSSNTEMIAGTSYTFATIDKVYANPSSTEEGHMRGLVFSNTTETYSIRVDILHGNLSIIPLNKNIPENTQLIINLPSFKISTAVC